MSVFSRFPDSSSIRLVLTGLLLSLAAIGTWVFYSIEESSQLPTDIVEVNEPETRGTPEDPHARLNYERRRLQNPETGKIPENVRKKELAFAKDLPEHLQKASNWKPRGPNNVGGRSRALGIDVSDGSYKTILAGGVSGGMWRTTDGGSSWTRTFDPGQRPNVTSLAQDTRSGRQDVWYAGTGELIGNSATGGGGAFYSGNGIYESTDGGQSWTLLSSTTGEETVFDKFFDYTYAIEIDSSATVEATADPGEDSEVYAATYGRIYRSTDGGTSWTAALTSNPDRSSNGYAARTDVEVTSSGEVYAALSSGGDDRNGLFYSTTGDPIGADSSNWTNITPSGWPSTFGRTVLAINPSNEDEVWALTKAYSGTGSGPNGHELWRYDQSTGSWTDYTSYLPNRGGATGTFNSQNGYDLIIEVHPDNGNVLFVGDINLWRIDVSASASDPNTWIGGYTSSNSSAALYNPSGSDPHHPDQHAIAFEPGNGNVMYVGSDGGIHRTDDNRAGNTGSAGDGSVLWTDLNNGYFTTQFYTVCQFRSPDEASETTFLAGGMQDNGTWGTTSGSVTDPWTGLLSGDGSFCSVTNNATDDGTSWYLSLQSGSVYRRGYDSSDNLQAFDQVDPSGASGQLFVNPFVLDPSNADVMYYPAGRNLWRKTDLETNPDRSAGWAELTNAQVPSNHIITALGVSSSNVENVLYYGTSYTAGTSKSGKVYRLDNANTTSAGTTPTEITGSGFPGGGYVSSIAVDPSDSDDVMVVFSNYDVTSIFYSTDGGKNWTNVEGNLEGSNDGFGGTTGPSVRSAAILPQPGLNQTTYYVGTSVGVYSTTSLDGSNTSWTQEGATKIGDVVVDQVRARAADGRVIIGTHANGTYSIREPLPVELAGFDAVVNGQSVQLSWSTAGETNNAGFEVEHKYRSGNFEKLSFVEGEGTTSNTRSYSYDVAGDLQPGPHTFRLKQVDHDGSSSYSEAKEVTVSPSGAYSLTGAAPNPFHQSTTMQLTVSEPQPVRAVVYNTLGQRVQTVLDREVSANQPLDLRLDAQDLASGMYVVQVEGENFGTTRKVTLVK